MAPLILHNVPDEECYVGQDGIKRPYAMIFNQQDHHAPPRTRRAVPESGSFGKSTRRSRSRTATPALRPGRENPTLAAADRLFGDWVSARQQHASSSATTPQDDDSSSPPVSQQQKRSQPVEIMLRGYRSSTQQYAALAHFESLAGCILEDYPREPPTNQRRYQSQLRDTAFTRRRDLTPEERTLVSRADGGEHWVKVTFESNEAADMAIYASPQRILGHLVYAEPYRGLPPIKDEAIPDVMDGMFDASHERSRSVPNVNGLPTSFSSRLLDLNNNNSSASTPPSSQITSTTIDTATLSSTTFSDLENPQQFPRKSLSSTTATASGASLTNKKQQDDIFCRNIPTARRAVLRPAELALRPQQSVSQRLLSAVPFLSWFGGSIIGNEIPRTETGEFDWDRASLYWKVIWWLDATFGLFRGDIYSVDKDE